MEVKKRNERSSNEDEAAEGEGGGGGRRGEEETDQGGKEGTVGRNQEAKEENLTERLGSVLGQIVPRKPIARFLRQIRRHGYY